MLFVRRKGMDNLEAKQQQIESQVERWDLFARLVPTVFLLTAIGLVSTGIIDFETAFWVGLALFAMTAVVWWFWTIFTIRLLIRTLNRASKNLTEVREEFHKVSKDIEALRNDN